MNMRKIIAVLAAVLMLCAAIPMGALSVAAESNVVWSKDFNDGELVFNAGEVVAEGPDGSNCMKWTASGGYSATYAVVANMDPGKDYTITLKAKGSVAGGMGITIQNGDWGSYWNGPSFNVSTEWDEIVIALPAGEIPFTAGTILFKFQDVGVAMDLYVDDIVISEGLPKIPLCENGDFENGTEGWILSQGSVVDATAAHSGSYGAHLFAGLNWNSMLERTFDVEAGKNYELTFWAMAVTGGSNVKYLDQNWQGTALAGGTWFDKTEWTQITVPFTAVSDKFYFQFCGAGDRASELYVDDVTLIEIKDPSFDGYIYNGDFEIGKMNFVANEVNTTGAWVNLWGWTTVEQVEGYNGDYAVKGTCNGWQQLYQPVAVTPNTNYTVVCYAKDVSNASLWIKSNGGASDITNKALNGGSDWALTALTFNSGDNSIVWVGLMGTAAGATYTVDDVTMFEAAEQSNDGYIINGNFETGSVAPWENLWGSCPTVETVLGGKDDHFALHVVSGKWQHVRQTNIAVEANTDYKISLWAKNVNNMNLLVKDNGDTANIANSAINGGAEWTYNEFTFNTGDNTAILVSLMGGDGEGQEGTFDNIVMEKVAPACEHEYDDCNDLDCNLCGETREFGHNLQYNPAKDPIDCATPGNIENWYCSNCNEYFANAEATEMINPWYISITVDCVRPEGVADCADWTCEVCGNENYGSGEHDTGVPACQDGHCSKCDQDVAGFGHQNYDGPACLPGNCYYCGEAMEPVAHENGAWAPCLEGECAYGCGLTYPATAEHVDEDGDDYCDTCWNHLAHVDADGDGWCDICWSEMPEEPVEIVYGDANGDGEITILDEALLSQYLAEWDVTLDEVAADANGDGEITILDEALLSQYLAEWDVTLGPIA